MVPRAGLVASSIPERPLGLETLQRLLAERPRARVLVLAHAAPREEILEARRAGA